MLKKLYLSVLLFLFTLMGAWAQSGTGVLQGKVLDEAKKEGIAFANVILEREGAIKGGATTDADGRYKFSSLPPGTYDLKVKFIGFSPKTIKGVVVYADKSVFVDIKLASSAVAIKEMTVEAYKVPLIQKDETSTGQTVTREEIAQMATRDVNSIAAVSAGVFQADEGGAINMRGGRSDATEYFVDGIRVRGSTNLPNSAIEQTTVITGGVPAQYGDVTGGVINVTTRGPSRNFSGGAEVLSSAFLEPYGYHLGALNITGPLWVKNKGKDNERAVLGYFLSGEWETQQDGDPSAIGVWQVNPGRLADLQANPLRRSPLGTGFVQNAQFLRKNDLFLDNIRPNAATNRMSFAGKIDFQPTDNFTFTLGGNYDRTWGRSYVRAYSLFNSANNPYFENQTFRVYGRIKQSFNANTSGDGASASSIIKNAFYTLQFDYTNTTSRTEDANLGRNAFGYGYLGEFDVLQERTFRQDSATVDGIFQNQTNIMSGFRDTLVTYKPVDLDPLLTAYNRQFFSLLGDQRLTNFNDIQQLGGTINGLRLSSVYGIWWNSGRQTGGYSYSNNDMFRVSGVASADIKSHAIKFGFEYDQRIDRGYSLNPFASGIGLWGHARGLMNRHLNELDLSNPIYARDEFGLYNDTIYFNRLYVGANQSTFDRNLRSSLGMNVQGLDIVQIDKLNPEQLKVSFFNPNELLNEGQSFVSYFGYDYKGDRLTSRPGQLDFFTDTTNRNIAPFSPIYMAGFIEDKFDFDDLVFRVGVRVDRFDANQPVLRDPFLLFPAKTAGQVAGTLNTANGGRHPGNIGNDYVVYVNDVNAATPTILGYRSGQTWFNANGQEIRNPSALANASAAGRITPYLEDPRQQNVGANAFTTYEPQINFMPRVAFSFPISDEALFFAHYDVLTQRPSGFLRFDPTDFYYLRNVGGTINNPSLLPEQTIDYELGFKQKLNSRSALTISAFYRELRNMIQIINRPFAYPVDYRTYGNIDFGTVKGLTIAYDLRRSGNIRFNGSYTLQFADGTGSAPEQAANIIQAGIDNLRTPLPLNFDARHRLVGTFDFRFGKGKNYNGPRPFGIPVLQNVGFNFVANAISGTPFSRQTFVTPDGDVAGGIDGRTTLKGTLNGSRLPWQLRVNLRVDKDIDFKIGKGTGDRPKMATVNVYLQVLNLFDIRNVLGVYRYTGDPMDDGFLTSNLGAQQLNGTLDPASFIDLYTVSMQNPDNFALPRRARIGVRFTF